MSALYVNNDHVVYLRELREESGALVSGAAVTMTLYEADGTTETTGATWPVTLNYTGSLGTYSGELPASVSLADNKRYVLKVTAVFVDKQLEKEVVLRANKRRELATLTL